MALSVTHGLDLLLVGYNLWLQVNYKSGPGQLICTRIIKSIMGPSVTYGLDLSLDGYHLWLQVNDSMARIN